MSLVDPFHIEAKGGYDWEENLAYKGELLLQCKRSLLCVCKISDPMCKVCFEMLCK